MSDIKSFNVLVFSVVIFIATGCNNTEETPALNETEKRSVEDLIESWSEYYNNAQFDALSELFTEDAVLFRPDSPPIEFESRDEIAEYYEYDPPLETTFYRTGEEIKIYNDTATAIGIWGVKDDEGPSVEGHYVFILKKKENEWLIHRNMYNVDWRRDDG